VTVIAALADGHTVWMAADTAEHVSGTLVGTARKIRRVNLPHYAGTILLGVAGAGGLAVAARMIERPAPDVDLIPDGDLDTWADNLAVYLTGIAAKSTPALTEPDRDGMHIPSGSWLLGYQGRLWHLLAHHALPVPDGMTALGAGIDYALGWMTAALSSSLATGARQEQIVRDAVTATCARIPYCAAPDGPLAEILNPAAERTPA
jgi:ATP-dependent protease HslVU (ClpYQ) peptidase subunit